MTPARRRAILNVTLVVVLVAGAGWLVSWLRDTAPTIRSDVFQVEAAAADPGEILLCDDLESNDIEDIPIPGRASSGEVLACPVAFDGLLVTYVGEVVGDVLRRDDGSWLLVNDDAYAVVTGPLTVSGEPSGTNSGLAVWVPAPADRRVTTAGRAGVRGDVVSVTGTVRRADPDDGGGLTIRTRELEVVAEAIAVEVPVHWRQVWTAVVLAAVVLVLTVRDRRSRR